MNFDESEARRRRRLPDEEYRPCGVCGATQRKLPVSLECINGHTPAEMDRANNAKRLDVWTRFGARK